MQARDDFVQLNNPKIKYRPSDFIIEISNDVYTKLTENINDDIDFYEVKSFGWYNKKEHLVEMRIFESGSNKLSKLEEKNPDIKNRPATIRTFFGNRKCSLIFNMFILNVFIIVKFKLF